MTQPVYILGGYQTDFLKAWSRKGEDISDMMRECVLGTLENCALDAKAVESIHVANAFGELQRQQAHLGAMVGAVVPELWGVPAGRHEGACASASLAVLSAMAEIEAGRYDCVLVIGAEEFKNLPGDAASQNQNSAGWVGHEKLACKFLWPAVFGHLALEYEKRYGLDRRYLNRIAEINYGNAKNNPLAQTRHWQFNEKSFTDDDEANPVIEPGTRARIAARSPMALAVWCWRPRVLQRCMRKSAAVNSRGCRKSSAGGIAPPGCPTWKRSNAARANRSSCRTCMTRSPTRFVAPAWPTCGNSTASKPTIASPPPNTWPSIISV